MTGRGVGLQPPNGLITVNLLDNNEMKCGYMYKLMYCTKKKIIKAHNLTLRLVCDCGLVYCVLYNSVVAVYTQKTTVLVSF